MSTQGINIRHVSGGNFRNLSRLGIVVLMGHF